MQIMPRFPNASHLKIIPSGRTHFYPGFSPPLHFIHSPRTTADGKKGTITHDSESNIFCNVSIFQFVQNGTTPHATAPSDRTTVIHHPGTYHHSSNTRRGPAAPYMTHPQALVHPANEIMGSAVTTSPPWILVHIPS